MSEQTIVTVDQKEDVVVATVQATEMGGDNSRTLEQELQQLAETTRELPIVLDLGKVTFLPSMSLGALVTVALGCRENQQRFILTALQPNVRDALAITRLDKVFEISDTVESAQQQLRLG